MSVWSELNALLTTMVQAIGFDTEIMTRGEGRVTVGRGAQPLWRRPRIANLLRTRRKPMAIRAPTPAPIREPAMRRMLRPSPG